MLSCFLRWNMIWNTVVCICMYVCIYMYGAFNGFYIQSYTSINNTYIHAYTYMNTYIHLKPFMRQLLSASPFCPFILMQYIRIYIRTGRQSYMQIHISASTLYYSLTNVCRFPFLSSSRCGNRSPANMQWWWVRGWGAVSGPALQLST